MRKFNFAGRTITDDSDPFVIAEIASNHQGRVDLCKHLIYSAKRAGCDAVKLQKRFPEETFTKALRDSPYVNDNSFGPTYGAHRQALEFNAEQWREIMEYARKLDIFLFSTAFDRKSVDFLVNLGIPALKVASGDLQNIPLLDYMAQQGLPMIISTGGGSWADLDRVDHLMSWYPVSWCFLHCVASYPNRPEEMNLNCVPAMRNRFPNTIIGLSDHYPGNLMALSAYGLGAQVFEKHFTKDKTWRGPDHHLSCDPPEMEAMIHDMHRLKAAWGSREKRRQECEEKALWKMGKSIYTTRAIQPGTKLTEADLSIKSPAQGLEPYHYEEVVGKQTARDLGEEEAIRAVDIKNYST